MTAKLKKSKVAVPLLLVPVLLLVPHLARAGDIASVGLGFVSKMAGNLAFTVGYILATVAGMAIALEAWVLSFVLHINTQIINSPPVAVGFPVAMSIANLALVFAIVVIAIMTILRMQTYGVKQTLWKLIVIAIAINFGLIVAGVILQFFDSMSFYFLNSVSPAAGGSGTGTVTQFNPYDGFASALAGAFQPQKTQILGVGTSTPATTDAAKDLAAKFGSGIAGLIVPITAVLFTIFALIFVIVTLGALIVMLVVRYVFIGYLLILLPLAWASWIFPATRSHWNKWWHNFFNQAAFAPIVLFFLWVAIQTSYALNSGQAFDFKGVSYTDYTDPNASGLLAAVSNFFGALFGPIISQFLNMAVLLGVMIGGLFAAKGLSIKFADAATTAAMGSAAWFGKGVGRWSARKGIQAGTAAARAAPVKAAAQKLQSIGAGRTGIGGRLARGAAAVTGLRALGGGLDRLAAVGGERAVKEAEKGLEGLTNQQIADRMATLDAPTRWAALKKLATDKDLGLVKNIDRYLGEGKKSEAARYNLTEFFNKTRGEQGLELKDLIRKVKNGESKSQEEGGGTYTVDDITKHLKTAGNAGLLAKSFFQNDAKLQKEKPLGMELNDVKEMQTYIVKGALEAFSGNNLSSFMQEVTRGDQIETLTTAANKAREAGLISVGRVSNSFKNYIKNNAARAAGIDEATFGFSQGDISSPSRIVTPPGAGEPRNVRSTTTFT